MLTRTRHTTRKTVSRRKKASRLKDPTLSSWGPRAATAELLHTRVPRTKELELAKIQLTIIHNA